MKYKRIVVEKIKSKNYNKVIRVNIPTTFYWTEDGFDGLEFGPIPKTTRHQLNLLHEILIGMNMDIVLKKELKKELIPDAFLRAFKEDKKKEDSNGIT